MFIKLTRELPWLKPCTEFDKLLDIIVQQTGRGRSVGLVVANTRKLAVPADLVIGLQKRQHQGELTGGILAGEALYLETYNLLRQLWRGYRNDLIANRIPIIAAGGVTTLASTIEVLRAGATAVQMCTAFDTYGPSYYSRL
jgi:dihydroorotate dehydrogenase